MDAYVTAEYPRSSRHPALGGLLKGLRRSLLSLVLALSLGGAAESYVMEGAQVLETMSAKMGSARGLKVTQTLEIQADSLQQGSAELDETLLYMLPQAFRSDISHGNTRQIHVVASGSALKIVDGRIAAEAETGLDRYKDLLLYRPSQSLERMLRGAGVDLSVSSLGRIGKRIAYVLGARYPDESVPQLWVDKESFRPLRWLVRNRSQSDAPYLAALDPSAEELMDIRYAQWRQFGRVWYPMQIDVYQNSLLLREIRVKEVLVNPVISQALFNIEYLKSIYPPAAPAETEIEPPQDIGEVQETIERFRKIFE